MSNKNPYPFPPPDGPPKKWDLEALANHLKTAMVLELATTPLYLCTRYSIKNNGDASGKIFNIARQEMLHLALAGNILSSIGYNLTLYDNNVIPRYPSKILLDNTDMKLRPADATNLQSFVDIEKPYWPPESQPAADTVGHFLPEYRSIGEFYENVEKGINALCPTDPCTIFQHNQDKQFTPNEFFDGEGMVVVKDKATALAALTTIVEQGEGTRGKPDSNSHYKIFSELLEEFNKTPWGYYNYIEEPHTDKYKSNPLIYRLSLALDASYCYLLQAIDRSWQTNDPAGRNHIVGNIFTLMSALNSLARLLVVQDFSGKSPAPCFEFYPSGGNPLSPADLFKALNSEIDEASKLGNQDVKNKLKTIQGMIQGAPPNAS